MYNKLSHTKKRPHRAPVPHLDECDETALYDLRIEHTPIGTLKPFERNARKHSAKQIQQIAASIRQFGFTNPVLIDAANQIIAGHGRVEAAKLLELTEIPTVCIAGLTDAEIRAYVIADNRLAENAGWDRNLLALELGELAELDLGFDIEIVGFDTTEIDLLLGGDKTSDPKADEIPEPTSRPVVSRLDDLWLLGKHRLLCGDARDARAYARLLAGEKPQLVFSCQPQNVHSKGHVRGKGSIHRPESSLASGEISGDEFASFLTTVLTNLAGPSEDSSIRFIVLDAFIGSGTTLIAAEKIGRIACGLEIDPANVDGAIRRYEAYTGKPAILAETGETFAEVAGARATYAVLTQSVQTAPTKPEPTGDSSDKIAGHLEARK